MLELEKLLPKKKASLRQLRVAELIKKRIADALIHSEVDSKILVDNFISITNVKISPDLKNATIYFSSYNQENLDSVETELNLNAPKFRFLLGKTLDLRAVPQITFRIDDSLVEFNKINELLKL